MSLMLESIELAVHTHRCYRNITGSHLEYKVGLSALLSTTQNSLILYNRVHQRTYSGRELTLAGSEGVTSGHFTVFG